MTEKTNIFEYLAEGFVGMSEQEDISHAESMGYRMFGRLYELVAKAPENGQEVAWITFGVPPQPFWAMDIVPYCDSISIFLASFPGVAEKYLDYAPIPEHVCAANRLPLGLAYAGDVPLPDLYVGFNSPCDSLVGLSSAFTHYFNLPFFCMGVPYENEAAGYKYMAKEFDKLFRFLEAQTGRKLDMEKLRMVMEESNKFVHLTKKLMKMSEEVPCPFAIPESLLGYGVSSCLSGTREYTAYLEALVQWAEGRKSGEIPPTHKEEMRIVFIHTNPAYDPIGGIYDYLKEEHNTTCVSCMGNHMLADPTDDLSDYDSMIEALVETTLKAPMIREGRGKWEDARDNAIDMCVQYKADGAVFAGHQACRANWAIAKMIKDSIQETLHIPVMNIEIDHTDRRVTPTDKLKQKFNDFMPLVRDAKGRRLRN